jgi:uncharacterized protein YidB (DUF937 family)
MGIMDNVLGTGAAGAGSKNAIRAAAILGTIALIQRAGGLRGIREKLQGGGMGKTFDSWVKRGPNEKPQESQLESALGPNILEEFARKLGLPQAQARQQLVETLPEVVDHATPNGEIERDDIPDEVADELSRLTRAV